jgi:hypothetical protein
MNIEQHSAREVPASLELAGRRRGISMGVHGTVLEVPVSFHSGWWLGFELQEAQISEIGTVVTVRKRDAVVTIYPGFFPARGGVPVLAVQYKEFKQRCPECQNLTEEIVATLIGLGAKELDLPTKWDGSAII